MKKVTEYMITYRPEDDAGNIHLHLDDDHSADLPIRGASEAAFLLDLFRNEKHVYYDPEHRLVSTGIDLVGGGEKEEKPKRARRKKKD